MQVMREGKDVTLVSFGKLVGYNLKAAEQLENEGISCEARSWTLHNANLDDLPPKVSMVDHSRAPNSYALTRRLSTSER